VRKIDSRSGVNAQRFDGAEVSWRPPPIGKQSDVRICGLPGRAKRECGVAYWHSASIRCGAEFRKRSEQSGHVTHTAATGGDLDTNVARRLSSEQSAKLGTYPVRRMARANAGGRAHPRSSEHDGEVIARTAVEFQLRSLPAGGEARVRWYAATCAAKYSWEMVIATSTIQGMRLCINAHRSHSKLARLRFARLG